MNNTNKIKKEQKMKQIKYDFNRDKFYTNGKEVLFRNNQLTSDCFNGQIFTIELFTGNFTNVYFDFNGDVYYLTDNEINQLDKLS